MTSYAQNLEDVIIRRALQDINCGFYIDVGAYDAVLDSVTHWFYLNGWRGVNVEPFPALHAKLQAARPEDANLRCAVGAAPGSRQFHIIGETGLSTLDEAHATDAQTAGYATSDRLDVPVQTLNQILECHGAGRVIDFLKIDAEGSEAEILNAASFSAVRPRLIVVEAVQPFTHDPAWAAWEPALLGQGYHFAWFDGLNRFYLRQEDAWRLQLFGIPAGVFDNFKLAAHAFAETQVAAQQGLRGRLRDNLSHLLAQGPPTRDGLLAQVGAITDELILGERTLADAIAQAGGQRRPPSASSSQTGSAPVSDPAASAAAHARDLPTGEPSAEALVLDGVGPLSQAGQPGLLLAARDRALALRLQGQERQIEVLSLALEASRLELTACREAIENLTASRDALLASLSWRMTAPARRAARLLARSQF
ncbi:MAG: FkbM family methyltransferase [Bryobacterales bacterium]|nr:FkbM family methyltransferase [Bryobacterales bacterium]